MSSARLVSTASSIEPRSRFEAERRVLVLAWPIVVSMLSLTVLGIVDTMVVGRLGTASLAAAGLASTSSFTVLSFGNGLVRGVKVVAAQRLGAGDADTADRLAWQGLWLSALAGLPLVLATPLAWQFSRLLGAGPDIEAASGAMLAIRVAGAPVLFASVALASFLQAHERTRPTMVANVLGYAVNVGLDLTLVRGWGPFPAWGVPGAGVAAVAGWTTTLVVLVAASWTSLKRTSARLDLPLLKEAWRLGGPMGLQTTLDVASFAFFASLLARVGEIDLAAHVITIRLIGVSLLPGYAIGEAAGVLVGQAAGARRRDEAERAFWASVRVAIGVTLALGASFVLVPDALIAGFHPEPAVAAVAHRLLLIAAAFQLFDALATVAYGSLAGAGDTRFAMISNGLVGWLVKLPVATVLAIPLGLGATGAWLGLTAEILALAAVSVWRITSGGWWSAAHHVTGDVTGDVARDGVALPEADEPLVCVDA